MNIGLPEQLAEVGVGEIDALLGLELIPFICVVSINQRLLAFHAEFYSLEGKLHAIFAHLFVVEVLVIVFVEKLLGDRCFCL